MPKFTTTRGESIFYDWCGQADAPPVIMVHGLAADRTIFNPQIREFKEHFLVYALDLPGHGDSAWKEKGEQYQIRETPEIIRDLMDHLDLPEAHIVGHSIGATTALLFAARYPDRVISLVLEGPAGAVVPLANFPHGLLEYLSLGFTVLMIQLMWKTIGMQLAGKVINWFGHTYKFSAMLTGMEEKMDRRALTEYSFSNADNPYRRELPNVKAPTLIIRGAKDQFPLRDVNFIRKSINAFSIWIEVPGSRHLVALEAPIEFNLVVVGFIKQIQKVDAGEINEMARAVRQTRSLTRTQ